MIFETYLMFPEKLCYFSRRLILGLPFEVCNLNLFSLVSMWHVEAQLAYGVEQIL